MNTLEETREKVETRAAVRKLLNGKAAGDDRVEAELVKNGGKTMIDWLMETIQEVWRTGQIPQEWKDATLVPLHKKDRSECTN